MSEAALLDGVIQSGARKAEMEMVRGSLDLRRSPREGTLEGSAM